MLQIDFRLNLEFKVFFDDPGSIWDDFCDEPHYSSIGTSPFLHLFGVVSETVATSEAIR